MTESKKPKKKPTAKKAVAKKAAAKKPAAKKPAAQTQPRKRPAAKTVVSPQAPTSTSAAKADIKVEVTATVPEEIKQVLDKAANVVKANDIINPSLRKRVLKWFTRK